MTTYKEIEEASSLFGKEPKLKITDGLSQMITDIEKLNKEIEPVLSSLLKKPNDANKKSFVGMRRSYISAVKFLIQDYEDISAQIKKEKK